MTAQERITEWAALADAATEGPWVAEYSCAQRDCVVPHDAESTMEAVAVTRLLRAGNDAAHIAASRTAVPAMAAALTAVLERHKPVTVYGECDCADEQKETGHVDVDEVGRTCNALYIICAECCRDDTYQTEDCADYHDHKPGEAICPTVADIETALGVTA